MPKHKGYRTIGVKLKDMGCYDQVCYIGVDRRNMDEKLSDEVIDLLKKVNEKVLSEITVDMGKIRGLVAIVQYERPRKR